MAKFATVEVKVPVSFFREERNLIAYSPSLDISTSGKDMAQAKKRFSEAVQIFMEELFSKGTLEEVLHDLGWKKVKNSWSPPTPVAHEMEEIEVPLG